SPSSGSATVSTASTTALLAFNSRSSRRSVCAMRDRSEITDEIDTRHHVELFGTDELDANEPNRRFVGKFFDPLHHRVP
ncbi:MAG: hypothetical protein WBF80_22370, partial [Rhodococcus sp. (in: high G+C Gram-positive bacteria)]